MGFKSMLTEVQNMSWVEKPNFLYCNHLIRSGGSVKELVLSDDIAFRFQTGAGIPGH